MPKESDIELVLQGGVDFPACFSALIASDINLDGKLDQTEFLGFIQRFANAICLTVPDAITLEQLALFNALACRCLSQEGADPNCCLVDPVIDLSGVDDTCRSTEESLNLSAICRTVDSTFYESRTCLPPTVEEMLPLFTCDVQSSPPTLVPTGRPTSMDSAPTVRPTASRVLTTVIPVTEIPITSIPTDPPVATSLPMASPTAPPTAATAEQQSADTSSGVVFVGWAAVVVSFVSIGVAVFYC